MATETAEKYAPCDACGADCYKHSDQCIGRVELIADCFPEDEEPHACRKHDAEYWGDKP